MLSSVLRPGQSVGFYLDNKLHHGTCLAIIDGEVLIEYRKANKHSLFFARVPKTDAERGRSAPSTIIVKDLRPCRYREIGNKWLQQMVMTGQTWKGIEAGGKTVPSPGELLKGQMELF